MKSPEVFYLHIQGEQRGPYSIAHIDHLLNSGLINETATFWREGLEQWEPVTNLVQLRRPRSRLKLVVMVVCGALIVGGLGAVFGPITMEGWREIYQHDYSERAAYWRARDAVRSQCVPKGSYVVFETRDRAEVQLLESKAALVMLRGALSAGNSGGRPTTWTVRLSYDAASREWTAVSAVEVVAP